MRNTSTFRVGFTIFTSFNLRVKEKKCLEKHDISISSVLEAQV